MFKFQVIILRCARSVAMNGLQTALNRIFLTTTVQWLFNLIYT